jgi:hypothetical protein
MTEHSNDRPPPAVFPRDTSRSTLPSPLSKLADIPEEEIWLAKQKSKRTRRAYKLDVQRFIRTLMIRSYDELRQVDHRAVIAWERIVREIEVSPLNPMISLTRSQECKFMDQSSRFHCKMPDANPERIQSTEL